MRWVIGNVHTHVERATDDERAWITKFLSYKDTTFRPGRSRKDGDRQVSLYNVVTESFPTGLGPLLYAEAVKRNNVPNILDRRQKPCEPDPTADLSWLETHPAVQGKIVHQIEAVNASADKRRGILWVPTGGGKGHIAVGVAQKIPCRWLFLVHRTSLLRQQAQRYTDLTGRPAGFIGDGEIELPPDWRFCVCSFQTMAAALRSGRKEVLDVLRQAQGLLIDECHALSAETYLAVSNAAINAYYRIGLSGTPLAREGGENLSTIGALGPVIYRIHPQTLIDLGLLATPKIKFLECIQAGDGSSWDEVYEECIVKSGKRNDLVMRAVARAARPCLVFVGEVEHGKDLLQRLEAAGVPAEFVWGKKTLKERDAAIERLVRTDTEVLICNVIFQEGIDIPSLRSVVIAGGGKSTIAAVQRVGRGIRADVKTKKTSFEVYDFWDSGCGCYNEDVQHDACKWLERHTLKRAAAYQNEGYTIARENEGQQTLPLVG